MCGASGQQKDIEAQQAAFYKQLTQEYGITFGESQGILKSLTAAFEPILKAGPNQQGFSAEELANLNSQAVTGIGRNYAKAGAALGAIQEAIKIEKSDHVRKALIRALVASGGRSERLLTELLNSPDASTREAAVRGLAGQEAFNPWPWPWPRPRPYP